MIVCYHEPNALDRILSVLGLIFPPRLGRMDDLSHTSEYMDRQIRAKGVENHPHMVAHTSHVVKEKRIICLPGRTV